MRGRGPVFLLLVLVGALLPVVGGATTASAGPARVAAARADQQVTLSVPAQVVQRSGARARGVVQPARKGRVVLLQQRRPRGWVVVGRKKTNVRGVVSFALDTTRPAVKKYRLKAQRLKRLTPVVSSVHELRVVSAAVPTIAVEGGSPASGTVSVSGRAHRPRARVVLYVDGVRTSATRASSGRWSMPWRTTELADGHHDVSVRSGGATGRLSIPLAVTVDNPEETDPSLPAGFRMETVAAGLTLPTAFVPLTEDSALVAEKAGTVRLVEDGRMRASPVLDITPHVLTDGDMGLLGMAVAPDFDRQSVSGELFLAYTYAEPGWETPWPHTNTQRVVRYEMADGVADTESATVLLGGVPAAQCDGSAEAKTPDCMLTIGAGHTVDDLLFDSQGRLLVAVGDSTMFWGATDEGKRALDPDVLVGKILRIDPDTGLGVPANPWYEPGAEARNRSRVLALGFRNPFRMALHPETGALYVGDVGGAYTEELNRVVAGANYGWPCFEGTAQLWAQGAATSFCPAMHDDVDSGAVEITDPVYSYGHTGSGGSITLGTFYAGGEYPEAYDGRLFLGDYAQSFLRTLQVSDDSVTTPPEDFLEPQETGGPVDFAMGPDGRVWYLAIATGELRRFHYDGGCQDGTFTAAYHHGQALAGAPEREVCEADAGGSWGDGSPVVGIGSDDFSAQWSGRIRMEGGTYDVSALALGGGVRVRIAGATVIDAWSGDGNKAESGTIRLDGGVHQVVVEYRHSGGAAGLDVGFARQGTAPVVRLTAPSNGWLARPGEGVQWSARATDVEDGAIPGQDVRVLVETLHYTHATHFHSHPEGERSGGSGTLVIGDDHAPGQQLFRLTAFAKDSSGWQGRSAPVYLCVVGNHVGPCA